MRRTIVLVLIAALAVLGPAPSGTTVRSASPCSVGRQREPPSAARWPRERSPPLTPATHAAGPTLPRSSPRSRVATPTSTCTPTTAWIRPTPVPGTSPAGRSAAKSGSDVPPGGGLEEGPGRALLLPVRVVPPGDAVLLSRADYDALEETAHLLRVPANAKRLVER